jgi:hypothetical protein
LKTPKFNSVYSRTGFRLVALAVTYFISGITAGAVMSLPWYQSGLLGAGAALLRTVQALLRIYVRDGKLPETEIDKIIQKVIDEAPKSDEEKTVSKTQDTSNTKNN